MKVKELIALLLEADQELEVCIFDHRKNFTDQSDEGSGLGIQPLKEAQPINDESEANGNTPFFALVYDNDDYKEFDAPQSTQKVLNEVGAERKKQEEKWGQQDHDPFYFLAILGEEVGEVNKAAVDAVKDEGNAWGSYREELIQVSAVAVAMIESIDRKINF